MDEEKPEPFERRGTKEQPLEITADEVLNAIADGRDVTIEYCVINGDLDIRKIASRLERDGTGRLVIKGNLAILFTEIHGDAYFSSASFSTSGRSEWASKSVFLQLSINSCLPNTQCFCSFNVVPGVFFQRLKYISFFEFAE